MRSVVSSAVDLAAVQRAVAELAMGRARRSAPMARHGWKVLDSRISPFARWAGIACCRTRRQPVPRPARCGYRPEGANWTGPRGPRCRRWWRCNFTRRARAAANAGGVLGVALDRRGSWSITLRRHPVVLGRDDPGARLARFAPLLPQIAAQDAQRRLLRNADLRYPNGFALTGARPPTPHRTTAPIHEPQGDKSLIVGLDIRTSRSPRWSGNTPRRAHRGDRHWFHESRGLRRGVVVDIDSTVQSIQRAVEEAELMAGCEVSSVYASISGNHVQCRNFAGVADPRWRVTHADLDRVLDAARRWRSDRASSTRSRANTCWTIRGKASATRSA